LAGAAAAFLAAGFLAAGFLAPLATMLATELLLNWVKGGLKANAIGTSRYCQ
jgi:hypothetical protein